MNNIQLAGAMLTSPSAAFAELRERPRFLILLLILIVAMAVQQYWFFTAVDFEWLKDHMFSGSKRFESMPPEARERAMSMMSQNVMTWSSVVSVSIMMPLVMTIVSAYYMLAGKITNVQMSFKHWFSLSVWTSLPMLIGVAAACAILLAQDSNAQIGPSELQVLSLNELFFKLPPSHPAAQMLMQVNPIAIWSWVLAVIGVKTWSNRTWLFASAYVMLPVLVVYGVWAYFAF